MPYNTISTDSAPSYSHVRFELQTFDATDVDTWLCMCDNIMDDAGLKAQTTIFCKCLARLIP